MEEKSKGHKQRSLAPIGRKDIARDAIVIGTAAIPVVGGALSAWLDKKLPDWRLARLYQFIEELAQDLDNVKESLDEQRATSPEYALKYVDTLQAVENESSTHKIRAYRATLVNGAVLSAPSDVIQELYRSWLSEMSEVQVVLASRLASAGERTEDLVEWLRQIPREILVRQLAEMQYLVFSDEWTPDRLLGDMLDPRIDFGEQERAQYDCLSSDVSRQFIQFITLPR